jgi:hypothetical protein
MIGYLLRYWRSERLTYSLYTRFVELLHLDRFRQLSLLRQGRNVLFGDLRRGLSNSLFRDDISEQSGIISSDAVEKKSIVIARLLNCYGNLFEMTTIARAVILFDERSLPTRYRSRCHVIN